MISVEIQRICVESSWHESKYCQTGEKMYPTQIYQATANAITTIVTSRPLQ